MISLAEDNTFLGSQDYDSAVRGALKPEPSDIDELGHVNNTVYLKWVQDIAVQHFRTLAPKEMQAQVFWVALRHEIDYRDPILLGDEVEVRTWLGKLHGAKFDRHVDIRKKGSTRFSSRSVTTWCMINQETKRPQRVPQDVLDMFGLSKSELC